MRITIGKIIFLTLFTWMSRAVCAQPAGALYAAMAGVSVESSGSWAIFHNPAFLALVRSPETGMDAALPYGIPELNCYALSVSFPLAGGGFGLGLERSGSDEFRNYQAMFGFGRSFGERFAAGLSFTYSGIRQAEGYPTLHLAGIKAGLACRLTRSLRLYISTNNPGGCYFRSRPGAVLPVIYQAGMMLTLSNGRTICILEAEKDPACPMRIKMGLEAHIGTRFLAGAGVSTSPATFCLGAGICSGRFRIDLAGTIHHYLGWYPQASILYNFPGREE